MLGSLPQKCAIDAENARLFPPSKFGFSAIYIAGQSSCIHPRLENVGKIASVDELKRCQSELAPHRHKVVNCVGKIWVSNWRLIIYLNWFYMVCQVMNYKFGVKIMKLIGAPSRRRTIFARMSINLRVADYEFHVRIVKINMVLPIWPITLSDVHLLVIRYKYQRWTDIPLCVLDLTLESRSEVRF